MAIDTRDIRMGTGTAPFAQNGVVQHLIGDDDQKYDVSTFYRNPLGFRNGTESLWISVKSANDRYMMRQFRRGYEPLEKYGISPGFGPPDRNGKRVHDSKELWQPILIHPDGPGEFPPDQIRLYRWWHPTALPGILRGHKIRFPQFIQAVRAGEYNGQPFTVEEIRCPECSTHSYLEPWHLARHLRNTHGYQPDQIFAIGREMGVDFTRTLRSIFQPVDLDVETDLSDLIGDRDLAGPDDADYLAAIKTTTPLSQLHRSYPVTGFGGQTVVPTVPEPDPNQEMTIQALLQEVARLQAENQNLLEVVTAPAATEPIPEAVTPVAGAVEEVKGSRKRD